MQDTPSVILSDPANPDTDNRLREFAHHLAKMHDAEAVPLPARKTAGISRIPKVDLLEQMEIWEQALRNANAIFKAVPSNDLPVSRAGEWMLDNFYVVKQTFRQIEENLPVSFLNQLPKLGGTPLQGHARIFALAWEWIGYSQSQLDLTQTAAFMRDYQQVTPLMIGELWALPSMLRIGILERLVYAAAELTGMDAPKGLSEIPSQFASPTLANETIVANCFLSLRLVSTTDWEAFFEQTSRVEQILRDDPAQIYAGMDFETRNSYRGVIEELARHSNFSEEQVALAAVELARSVQMTRSRGEKACRLLSAGCGAYDARSQHPLPAWIKPSRAPRTARVPHCHISGKYRQPFYTLCFGTAHLRNAFGRFACPTYRRQACLGLDWHWNPPSHSCTGM
jgi:hypothetical protein